MVLTRRTLIADLLDLGFRIHRQHDYEGKATLIVRTIFDTIRDALLRGESVTIDGLGTFKPRKKARHNYPARPNSLIATFRPDNSLLEFINEPQAPQL